VGETDLAAAVGAVADAAAPFEADDPITQFEVLTAAAFVVFARAGVDAMVVEAGLGGRWDATNVLDGAVVCLTNVSLEHTDLLGDTLEGIAEEKLAVAPDGWDGLVLGRMDTDSRAAVRAVCRRRGLDGWWMDDQVTVTDAGADAVDVSTPLGDQSALPCPVRGAFQRANLALAVACAQRRTGAALPQDALRTALAGVAIPGQMEPIAADPLILLDGAHNPGGMAALASELDARTTPRVVVTSILRDKDLDGMLAPFSGRCDVIVATRSSSGRARDPREIARAARARGITAECVEIPLAAIGRARDLAGAAGEVLVCGSLYLLADVRGPAMARWGRLPGMLADESAGNIRI